MIWGAWCSVIIRKASWILKHCFLHCWIFLTTTKAIKGQKMGTHEARVAPAAAAAARWKACFLISTECWYIHHKGSCVHTQIIRDWRLWAYQGQCWTEWWKCVSHMARLSNRTMHIYCWKTISKLQENKTLEKTPHMLALEQKTWHIIELQERSTEEMEQ